MPHAVDVATTWVEDIAPPAGVTVEVFAAGVCFAIGAGTVPATGLLVQNEPTVILLLGWPAFALAGGVILDRQPGSSLGRFLTALALMPVLDLLWAIVDAAGVPDGADINRAVAHLGALQVLLVAIGVPWLFRGLPRLARVAAGPAVVGATAVAVAGPDSLMRSAEWAIVIAAVAAAYLLIGQEVLTETRESRRRTTWLLVILVVSGIATGIGWIFAPSSADFVTTGALWLTAFATVRLVFVSDFRPLAEHALDVAVVLATLAAAAVVGGLVLLGAQWTPIPSPRSSAAFSALVTLAMTVPAALWARRAFLARRYGNGTISPSDVAMITADLHAQTEPRDLLDKAARMVASASGSREASIVLGDEAPAVPDNWVLHPLVVGGDQVGALLVESGKAEGPELRQQRVVAQLLPTVALVARAVGLAVEAEHARLDVSRERDAERNRILGDLHDGLGPVLAGMSMRVQATLRTTNDPVYADLLTDLSADLARSRTDLRRLVAGITPSVLDEGDLASALDRLVRQFRSAAAGPGLGLDVRLPGVLPSEVQVAVYRCVAEGITNALRHARASHIDVTVHASGDHVLVDVVDNGAGGPVVAGVGLASLAQRAEALGGCLEMSPVVPRGTRLHLQLPARPEVTA